ncbi:MAG: glycosyltransferase [Bacteroidales bacterium]|jgi:glycosyltransferase involved in cell wall biosynthesis|nr:glycosyltransferase [Bacteroidales bacterium]
MNIPLISIITVVYNSERYIGKTIESIRKQTSRDFEYIIIDGNSTDETLNIISKYKNYVDKLISEPDKGLYDAMNKGLHYAVGKYVWFINSGDRIFSVNTVEKIENLYKRYSHADVFYGQTQLIDEQDKVTGMRRKVAPEYLTAKSLTMGLVVCHQSILVKREIAPQYDLSYKIAADYEWVLASLEKSKEIVNTHLVLSKFLENGFSSHNVKHALKDRLLIMLKHYGFFTTLCAHIRITIQYIKDKTGHSS